MIGKIGKTVKRIALGEADVSQQCTVGMPDPQRELRISLEGLGAPIDITNNHVIACAAPFTVGIGLSPEQHTSATRAGVSLKFLEENGEKRLLAEVQLEVTDALTASAGQQLSLFHIRSCRNYCLPQHRIWAHDFYQAFVRLRSKKDPEIPVTMLGTQAMNIFFMCPRPVVLVSAREGDASNIFPMNLFGRIGEGHFVFALNSFRKPAPLVARAGRAALSSVPVEQASVVRQLGKNHRADSADWDRLPFAIKQSTAFGLPIPDFALRVREVEIEAVRKLGSHTLFFARMVRDERLGDNLQFCMIHGIYELWRRQLSRSHALE